MIPTARSVSQANRGARGLVSFDPMYRTSHTPNTPMAYPIAPAAPLTIP